MIVFDRDLARTLSRGTSREVRDRAFQLRAGFIGAAQSCLCAWPIARHATSSEHDHRCPAHAIIESAKRAAAGAGRGSP